MDKALKTIASAFGIAVILFLLWYFRNIVVYIAISAVVALIGRPLVGFLTKFKIGKVRCPAWVASIVTIIAILGVIGSIGMLLYPLISPVISRISEIGTSGMVEQISPSIRRLNEFIIRTFPAAGADFRIENMLASTLYGTLNLSNISAILGSIFNFLSNFAVGAFSVIFISFFFLSNDGLFTDTVAMFAPEKYDAQIHRASDSISHLLSRYFLGIIAESIGITLLNSIGLIFILKMEPSLAIVLALVTGILNVIPYVGPFIGHILALIISAFVSFYTSSLEVSMPVYLIITFAITMSTQLIDNYLFQPLIYASSVKAHPLEIFIVILMAATVGGIVGMLVAIPTYTMFRVIAAEFLSKFRFFDTISKGIEDSGSSGNLLHHIKSKLSSTKKAAPKAASDAEEVAD